MKKLFYYIFTFLMALLFVCGGSAAYADNADSTFVISEVMIKNRCTVLDSDGDFSDWIELENCGSSAIRLKGYTLSDGTYTWELPDAKLESGDLLLVFASGKDRQSGELHTNFHLSAGETIKLICPDGKTADSVICPDLGKDYSYLRGSKGFEVCSLPSPGYHSYIEMQENSGCAGPLIIYEAMSGNHLGSYSSTVGLNDWVEIKNISDETINLSDYYLSDDINDPCKYQMPKKHLSPGRAILFVCNDKKFGDFYNTGFKLSSDCDRLYLSSDEGIIDFMLIRGMSVDGSIGRMDKESGIFYFASPTPNAVNRDGLRTISSAPTASQSGGVFEGESAFDVEFTGEGTIYYTSDGSIPTERSQIYTTPIHVDSTCVLRACALQEGCIMSPAVTESYIINEGHTLPVVSLATDNPSRATPLLMSGSKQVELSANLEFYEPEGSFNIPCGMSLSGQNSLTLLKKSIQVDFRGEYGCSELEYDLFGSDVKEFSSLSLRSGQDNHRTILRQEIWQDLAFEMSDKVISQDSKFAVLYINGEYYGLICIKENICSEYFAAVRGVSENSVDVAKVLGLADTPFCDEVVNYCIHTDLSIPENYEEFCRRVDIESYIDWFILEGSCANTDLFKNTRFYRSSELDGRWQAVLFDLDHGMLDDFKSYFRFSSYKVPDRFAFGGIMGNCSFPSNSINIINARLLKNPDFRDALLTRYAEVYDTVLSNERLLERIDYYQALLEPEVERDWLRWYEDPADWYAYLELLRSNITELDWQNYCKDCLLSYMGADEAEIAKYFS